MTSNICYVVWEEPIDSFQDGSYSQYTSCGHTIRRDWNYCPYCGKRVSKGEYKDYPDFVLKQIRNWKE